MTERGGGDSTATAGEWHGPANRRRILAEFRVSTADVQAFARRFVDVQGTELAAALAYRLAVGLFPFLIFVVGLFGAALQFAGGEEPATRVVERMDVILSEPMAGFLEGRLTQIAATSPAIPIVLGAVTTVSTATFGGLSIIRHLNAIHGRDDRRGPVRRLALAMVVGGIAGAGALAAFLVLLVGSMDPRGLAGDIGLHENAGYAFEVLRWPLAFVILTASVATIYHLAPARDGELPEISLGALVFAVTWTISSGVFVFYLRNAGTFTATYGTLAGVVAILVWVYLASLAFVIGAVIDAELESRNG